MRHFLILFLLLVSVLSRAASAETQVQSILEPKSGDASTIFRLEVQVSSDLLQQIVPPAFARSEEFIIESRGQRRTARIFNGEPSQSLSFLFQVTPRKQLPPGEYQLPEGTMQIGGATYSIGRRPVVIEPGSGTQRKGPVDFVQMVENLAPFEGEQLTYRAELVSSTDVSDAVIEEVNLEDFFREEFPEQKQVVRRVSNSRVVSVREALFPNHPGVAKIPARSLTAKVREKSQRGAQWGDTFEGLWDVFDEFDFKPARYTAPEITLNVRPLPPKPSGVSGYVPVGNTTVSVSIDRTELRAGDTALLELTVESEGNLKPYEFNLAKLINVPNLKVYTDKAEIEKRLVNERVISRKTFRAAIVPEYGGAYEIPAAEVSFFDPGRESYEVATAQRISLVVGGPKAPEEVSSSEPAEVSSVTEELPAVSETREFAAPGKLLSVIGVSRRVFLLLLFIIVLSLPVYSLAKSPPVTTRARRFSEVMTELKGRSWEIREEDLELLRESALRERVKDGSQLEAFIDRVKYAPPEVRRTAEEELKAYLREYR